MLEGYAEHLIDASVWQASHLLAHQSVGLGAWGVGDFGHSVHPNQTCTLTGLDAILHRAPRRYYRHPPHLPPPARACALLFSQLILTQLHSLWLSPSPSLSLMMLDDVTFIQSETLARNHNNNNNSVLKGIDCHEYVRL